MILDELGLPRDSGSTDRQDSARLAGLMTVFNFGNRVDLTQYYDKNLKAFVRHPLERRYDFSRDQAICLMAGYWVQGLPFERSWVTGRDWFSPSHTGHVKLCKNLKPNFLERAWLWADVLWSCYVTPTAEPNQILCMMMPAHYTYLKFWLKHNKKWCQAIEDYWCGWRSEPDLAARMISLMGMFEDIHE